MALDVNRLRDLAISDTGFVFDPVTGRTFTVNETGLLVLQTLKAGEGLLVAARALVDAFDVQESEDLAADVEDFVARLREQGFIA